MQIKSIKPCTRRLFFKYCKKEKSNSQIASLQTFVYVFTRSLVCLFSVIQQKDVGKPGSFTKPYLIFCWHH